MLTTQKFGFTIGIFFCVALSATPRAGTYIYDGGMGSLKVKEPTLSQFTFDISTFNYQAHVCEIEGRAVLFGSRADFNKAEDRCKIHFIFSDGKATVAAQCDSLCGKGVSLEGEYRIPPQPCTDEARKRTRAEFTKLYRDKQYQPAGSKLESLLKSCNFFMDKMEAAWIRNDLAINEYHAGYPDRCLSWIRTPEMSDLISRDPSGPFEKEQAKLIKAVRANIKLCAKNSR